MPDNHAAIFALHAKRLRLLRRIIRRIKDDLAVDRKLVEKSHADAQQIVSSTAEIRLAIRELQASITGRHGWQEKATRIEQMLSHLEEFRKDQKALNIRLFLMVIGALAGALWSVLTIHWPDK